MVPDSAPLEATRPCLEARSAKMDRGGARSMGVDGRSEPTASSSAADDDGSSGSVGGGGAGALVQEIEALCADDLTEVRVTAATWVWARRIFKLREK
jgi:hypothetical protein